MVDIAFTIFILTATGVLGLLGYFLFKIGMNITKEYK